MKLSPFRLTLCAFVKHGGARAPQHRMNLRLPQLDRDRLSDWPQRLPAAVEVALVLVLAVQFVRIFWLLVVPDAPIGTASPATPVDAAAPAFPTADVFFRRAGAGTPAGGADKALGYTLHGVRLGDTGGSAILGKDGRQASYAVGGTVAPGITLDSVDVDHAVLLAADGSHRLQLPSRSTPAATARTASLPTGTATPAPAGAAAIPPATTATGRTTEAAPAVAAETMTTAPGGHVVASGPGDALLRMAGLQAGDVVLSVDGRPFDPSRVGDLAKQLGGRSQATVQYRREGRIHTTTVKAPQ